MHPRMARQRGLRLIECHFSHSTARSAPIAITSGKLAKSGRMRLHERIVARDEASLRYEGWRVVAVCFLAAIIGWSFAFYGQSVYLAEVQRQHGWPASLISTATTYFYLLGAFILAFVGDAVRIIGPRRSLMGGIIAMAGANLLVGYISSPWQLYVVDTLLAIGWAGTSVAMVSSIVGLWFDKKRGMAVSFALNGASFGGILGVPLLVAAIARFGFSQATTLAAVIILVLMVPAILILVGRPPARSEGATIADSPSGSTTRAKAFRDLGFVTVSGAFALALLAQVGFLVHLISFLDPIIGRTSAALALSVLTASSLMGRLAFSPFIDRFNHRWTSAVSFAGQALALVVILHATSTTVALLACAGCGLFFGNILVLPSLIVQREFAARSFAVLISLSSAIGQITYALGPGIVGWLRDFSGSYQLPFYICAAIELSAAFVVLIKPKARSDL